MRQITLGNSQLAALAQRSFVLAANASQHQPRIVNRHYAAGLRQPQAGKGTSPKALRWRTAMPRPIRSATAEQIVASSRSAGVR